ncbi:MAG: DEAD/DEAH box helicase [Thermoleophilia bacterium]
MFPHPPNQPPRKWQEEAFQAARSGLKTWDRIIISAATGTGKGNLISGIAQAAADKGKRVLITTEREELVTDLANRIARIGKCSIVMAKLDDWTGPIIVASAQSLTPKRLATAPKIDLLLPDEVHHYTAPSRKRIIDHFACKTVGMTATPFRSAPKGGTSGLGDVFQAVVYEYGIREAIENGDLCQLQSFRVKTSIDLSSVRTIGDDWQAVDLAKAIDTPDRNRLVVEQYLSRCGARPTLVFAVTVEHAQHLTEAFQEAGIPARAAWGAMKDRRAVVDGFKVGAIPVVVSVDLIREGFDAPNCAAILKARPTQSRIVFVQMLGRSLRKGKPDALFIDLVDNGCPLDLSDLVDLSRTSPTEKREWKPGDLCVRRHHEDQGIGCIEAIEERIASVQWKTARSKHPLSELDRPKQTLLDTPELLTIEPRISGVKSYEIFLLGGQKATEDIGFYEYQKTWTASGLSDRAAPSGLFAGTPYGSSEKDRWTVHICDRFEVWSILNKEDPTKIGTFTDKGEAIRFGQKWLLDRKVRGATAEDWKGKPATPADIKRLSGLGLKRDFSAMTKGEVDILIEAASSRARVQDWRHDTCSCGSPYVLSDRLFWFCQTCRKSAPDAWKKPKVWTKTFREGKPTGLTSHPGLRAVDCRAIERRETTISQIVGFRR